MGLTTVMKGLGGSGRPEMGHMRLKGKELECLVPRTKHLYCSVGGRSQGRHGTIQSLAKKKS